MDIVNTQILSSFNGVDILKKDCKKEFNSRFVIDQLEQYQQDWFKELIERRIEKLHCTIETRGNLFAFRYTYNIYLNENIYQVVVTLNQIESARHLYRLVKMTKNNTIAYQPVRGQQIVNDSSVIEKIGSIMRLKLVTQ